MSSHQRPWVLKAAWTVVRGRDTYLDENGFTVAEYDQPTSSINYAGLKLRVPNPTRRRWAIRLHDLHHVATGFGTDPLGEAEISAWELRHGLRHLGPYVGAIVVTGALAGLFLSPKRTWRAFRAGAHGASLFNLRDVPYESLLSMSIGELRALLGIPQDGLADEAPRLHAAAPNVAAVGPG